MSLMIKPFMPIHYVPRVSIKVRRVDRIYKIRIALNNKHIDREQLVKTKYNNRYKNIVQATKKFVKLERNRYS